MIRAPNWLGDAVMALPAMGVVRAACPKTHIAIAAVPAIAPLFAERTSAAQDSVIVLQDHAAEIPALRAAAFDAALLLPNSFRSAWSAYRASIPERWGYAAAGRRPLLTRSVRRPRGRIHQSEYYLALVEGLGFTRGTASPHVAVEPRRPWRAPKHCWRRTASIAPRRVSVSRLALRTAMPSAGHREWLQRRLRVSRASTAPVVCCSVLLTIATRGVR